MTVMFLRVWGPYAAGETAVVDEKFGAWLVGTAGVAERVTKTLDFPPRDKMTRRLRAKGRVTIIRDGEREK